MDKSVDKKPIYICLICFIISLVSGFFILYQPLQKWAICKIEAEAEIVEVEDKIQDTNKSDSEGLVYRCVYEFNIHGETIRGYEFSKQYNNAWNHSVGDKVAILVNANNPKEFMLKPVLIKYCKFGFVPVIFLVISGVIIISLIRDRKV